MSLFVPFPLLSLPAPPSPPSPPPLSSSPSELSSPDLPKLLLQFCKQVVDGLACLARKSFVHRDIAARNILLDKDLNCKVCTLAIFEHAASLYSMKCALIQYVNGHMHVYKHRPGGWGQEDEALLVCVQYLRYFWISYVYSL